MAVSEIEKLMESIYETPAVKEVRLVRGAIKDYPWEVFVIFNNQQTVLGSGETPEDALVNADLYLTQHCPNCGFCLH